MEEEKKNNKKAGMRRALNVRDILNKKYDVFPFEGKWKDAFDTPEVRGCWFVWGNSGNGKTSFVMQLCKELCKYDRVAFNSLEEGTSLTVQNNLRRFGMAPDFSRRCRVGAGAGTAGATPPQSHFSAGSRYAPQTSQRR